VHNIFQIIMFRWRNILCTLRTERLYIVHKFGITMTRGTLV